MIEHKISDKNKHHIIIRPNPAMPWKLIKKIAINAKTNSWIIELPIATSVIEILNLFYFPLFKCKCYTSPP